MRLKGIRTMPDIGVLFKSIPPMVWGLLALGAALKVFLLWWNSTKQKGARGERLVAGRLRRRIAKALNANLYGSVNMESDDAGTTFNMMAEVES